MTKSFGAVVCLPGRAGDLINSLPCVQQLAKEFGSCAVVVTPEFAPVLEGCSYATPILFDGSFTDTNGAIELANKHSDHVLVGRVSERSEHQCEHFNQESWKQLGFLDQWDSLPLVFDRRNRLREAELVDRYAGTRNMVLMNFTGKSNPFPHGDSIKALFRDWNVVDLGAIKAHRIHDLLGLMDTAKLLITCDTATLHLSAASKVRTINLIADRPSLWHGSKPRNNNVLALIYGEVLDKLDLVRAFA